MNDAISPVRVPVRVGLFLSCVTVLLFPGASFAGFNLRIDVKIPAGQSATVVAQFTKDGAELLPPSIDTYDNGTANAIVQPFLATAPADANDRHYKIKFGPLTTTDPEAGADLPDLVPDLGIYLATNGHTDANPLNTPLVIADLNSNSSADPTDAPAYSLISNLPAYDLASSATTFTLGQLLTTNALGQVSGLAGLTFYSDPTFTTPAANSSLLIVGTSAESVPEPHAMVAGLFALALARRRVRRAVCG